MDMHPYGTTRRLHPNASPVFSREYRILLSMLFLMSLNFVSRFYYMVFFAAMFLLIVQHHAIKLPRAVLPSLLLSISLCLFSPTASASILGLLKQFAYPLCVLIGYNLISSTTTKVAEKQATTVTITLAMGAYVHYLLNLLLNRGMASERNMFDIWTGSTFSATGQAALACMIVAVAMAILFISRKKTVKLLMIAILLSVVYYNLMLAGRTLFVLLGMAFVVAFITHLIVKATRKERLRLLFCTAVCILLLVILLMNNVFGIQEILLESNFYDRFYGSNAMAINEDGRMEKKLQYLSLMVNYPFGGGHLQKRVGSYAHDIILDTYDEAGFFALIAIVLILADMVIKCMRILRSKRITGDFKILIATYLAVIMAEFMVEPILAGMAWLMAGYCILYGAYGRIAEMR